MPVQTSLAILVCLILGITGCMKAVPPGPVPLPPTPSAEVAAPPPMETAGPYDSEIPAVYRSRLEHPVADEAAPLTLLSIAGHFAARGEADKALHFLDRAADRFAVEKTPSGEAAARGRKVMLLLCFNREQEALDLIRGAAERWKTPPLNAFAPYWEGHRALLRGDFLRALSLLNQSLRDNTAAPDDPYLGMLRRDTELDTGIAAVLSEALPRLLAIYGTTGAPVDRQGAAGETHLRNALALNRELRQTRVGRFLPAADFARPEADAYNFLGLAAGMRGDLTEAHRHLAAAGEWARTAGSPAAEIRSLLFLGELGLQSKEDAGGPAAARLLLERADHYRASRYRVWARLILARYEARSGRTRDAIGWLRSAAAVAEAERSGLKADMVDAVCRRQRRALYESLVELLSGEGMALEALTAAEMAKSLATVDLLAEEALGRTTAEQERIRAEAALGDEVRDLQRTLLLVPDPAAADLLRGRLTEAEAGYRELLDKIAREDPDLLRLVAARAVDPAALQRLLDGNTTLFDYFATAGGLYVWAIQRGRIHQERIDLPREALRSLVLSFRAAIRDRNRRRTETVARRAYDLLLKPVIPFVSGDRIGFIPDDALAHLPFAALNYRGKFLAEGFSLFQLPAADLFDGVGEAKSSRGLRILAFGDPDLENGALDLQHAARELEQIRKRIGATTVLLGRDASEARVWDVSAGYDILHFAVRGWFVPEATLDSGLLLTPGAGRDGRLTIREIFGLRLDARGIVLSGSDPMPDRDPAGRGLLALQRSLLNTGSRAVISTLWQGEEKAVAHLMGLFYRQLERRASFPDALRAAQVALIREGQPPHVWAAFVLTGGY